MCWDLPIQKTGGGGGVQVGFPHLLGVRPYWTCPDVMSGLSSCESGFARGYGSDVTVSTVMQDPGLWLLDLCGHGGVRNQEHRV